MSGKISSGSLLLLVGLSINWVDVTGFARILILLAQRRVTLHQVGIKLPVELALQAAGLLHEGPNLQLYRTEAEALRAFVLVRLEAENGRLRLRVRPRQLRSWAQ